MWISSRTERVIFYAYCGKAISDQAPVCPNCGRLPQGGQPKQEREKTALSVVSFFFPLLGIFFWYWLESSRPQTSAACGKYAFLSLLILIGLIAVSFLISLILGIVRGGV